MDPNKMEIMIEDALDESDFSMVSLISIEDRKKMDMVRKKLNDEGKYKVEEMWKIMKKNGDLMKKVAKLDKENRELKEEFVGKNADTELQGQIARLKEELVRKSCELQEEKVGKKVLANLADRIGGMELSAEFDSILMQNKFDGAPKLSIFAEGLIVTHSGSRGYNCARSILPIQKFNLPCTKPSIAFYFEVQIIGKSTHSTGIWVGFCAQQFPQEGKFIGHAENSIGICHKGGMWVDGTFNRFGKAIMECLKAGDIIGLGMLNLPGNARKKCFATCNGELLKTIKLPWKFTDIELFAAVTLFGSGDSIYANFGRDEWRFKQFKCVK